MIKFKIPLRARSRMVSLPLLTPSKRSPILRLPSRLPFLKDASSRRTPIPFSADILLQSTHRTARTVFP